MKVITDSRVLNAVAKKHNLNFCPKYKYLDIEDPECDLPYEFPHNGNVYRLKYFDGCFKLFLIQIN
jgi:hypothetical protein